MAPPLGSPERKEAEEQLAKAEAQVALARKQLNRTLQAPLAENGGGGAHHWLPYRKRARPGSAVRPR